jgi:hypothetical protein
VETGQLIFAVRSVLLSERVVMATLCVLLNRHLPVCDQPLRRGNFLESQFINT